MVERLSEDARNVLAFVRAYPGVEAKHIALDMSLDLMVVMSILTDLAKRELIQAKSYTSDEDNDEFEVTRFYPKF